MTLLLTDKYPRDISTCAYNQDKTHAYKLGVLWGNRVLIYQITLSSETKY